jgi:hypothetical protein
LGLRRAAACAAATAPGVLSAGMGGHAAGAAVVLGVRAARAVAGLDGLRPGRGMQNHAAGLTRCLDRLGRGGGGCCRARTR